MNDIQEKIKRFNDERDWSTFSSVKDLLLNMNEEIGEFWNFRIPCNSESAQKS